MRASGIHPGGLCVRTEVRVINNSWNVGALRTVAQQTDEENFREFEEWFGGYCVRCGDRGRRHGAIQDERWPWRANLKRYCRENCIGLIVRSTGSECALRSVD